MMKRVVITGATSMIGIALIVDLLNSETVKKIYAVVRKNCTKIAALPSNPVVEIVECNIEDYNSLPEKIKDQCDVFYHLAWKSAGRYEERNSSARSQCCNVEYSLDALDAAHELNVTTFIGAGSQAEYGKVSEGDIGPRTPVNPTQFYGIAKYAAGTMVREQAKLYDMNCFWVRIFSVYGKNDSPTTMISSTVRKLLSGEKPIFTPAVQRWDYLCCSDAGRALRLVGNLTGNKVYCLGSGTARKLKDYIEDIRDIIDPLLPIGVGEQPYPHGVVMNLCADISELTKDTGWIPTVDFRAGIKEFVNHMKGV